MRSPFVVLSLGSIAYAASIASTCPETDICYELNIPETTASSGNGDIYFQISASTSYSWVALGQGTQMAGSNIFVMYTSANGQNVTVSPRLGTGHVMPEYDTAAQVTVLSGSGVSNGRMIANVKCSNCNSWSGGTMDFTGSSSSWIYAYKSGSALNSDDVSETISQHNSASSFTWSLSSAQGGSDANPFVSGSEATTSATGIATSCTQASGSSTITSTLALLSSSGCPTAFPFSTGWPTTEPSWASTCFSSGYSWPTEAPWSHHNQDKRDDSCSADSSSTSAGSDSSGSGSGSATFTNSGFGGLSLSAQQRMLTAHGVLACLAFVALFPIGGILIRLANFTGLVWVHAAVQVLGYLIFIIAFGLGLFLATNGGYMHQAHPTIGIVLFIVLLFQPFLGVLHHRLFKKYQHRTLWSYAHLSVGRIAIILGLVNGGLGLQLAGATHGAKIAYAVVVAIVGLIYIAAVVAGEFKRRKQSMSVPPTYARSQRDMQERASKRGRSNVTELTQQREFYGRDEPVRPYTGV